MFIAFTTDLEYNQFACGEVRQQALTKLISNLRVTYTENGTKPSRELDRLRPSLYDLTLKHGGYERGAIYTGISVIELTPEGVAFDEYKPAMEGDWVK